MVQQNARLPLVRLLRTIPVNGGPVLFGPPGLVLVARNSDIDAQNLRTGAVIRTLKKHRSEIVGLCLSQDGGTMLSMDRGGGLYVTEWATGRTLRRITLPPITSAATAETPHLIISPDKRYAGVCYAGVPYRVLDLRTGKRVFAPPGAVAGAFSLDGKTLVTGGMWWVRTWKVGSWKPVTRVNVGDASSHPVDVAPDGKTVYTVTHWFKAQASAVQQVRADSLVEVARFTEKSGDISFGSVTSAALSPNGRWLAVGIGGFADNVQTLALWEVGIRKEIAVPRLTAKTTGVSFSNDGRFLISVSDDGARIWEVG